MNAQANHSTAVDARGCGKVDNRTAQSRHAAGFRCPWGYGGCCRHDRGTGPVVRPGVRDSAAGDVHRGGDRDADSSVLQGRWPLSHTRRVRNRGQFSSWSRYKWDYSSWVDQSGQDETAALWTGTTSRGETATEGRGLRYRETGREADWPGAAPGCRSQCSLGWSPAFRSPGGTR
jgi:hypothetical protein